MTYNEGLSVLSSFVNSANIVSQTQLEMFLKTLNVDEKYKENILKTALKRRMIYTNESNSFYTAIPDLKHKDFTPSVEKSVWCYLKYIKNYGFNYSNFKIKLPGILYLSKYPFTKDDMIQDLTFFYLPKGLEDMYSNMIEINYGVCKKPLNIIIILDDEDQIDAIELSDIFNIIDVISVDKDGNIKSLV